MSFPLSGMFLILGSFYVMQSTDQCSRVDIVILQAKIFWFWSFSGDYLILLCEKAFQAAFSLMRSEMASRELAAARVKHLLSQGIAGGIEVVAVSHDSNSHGEWLFITLQALNPLSEGFLDQWLQLTVYGLGYDFAREQWVESFRFVGKTLEQAQAVDPSVLQLSEMWKEAEADVRIGLKEPSSRAECHILLNNGEIPDDGSLLDEFEKNHPA